MSGFCFSTNRWYGWVAAPPPTVWLSATPDRAELPAGARPGDAAYEAFLAGGSPEPCPWALDPAEGESATISINYTSGTTGAPKGAVLGHAALAAQTGMLRQAWGWSEADRILHVLPLHHTHGLVNALLCSLASGACCEFLPRFDPAAVWERLASGEITLFMAVPTLYLAATVRVLRSPYDDTPARRLVLAAGFVGIMYAHYTFARPDLEHLAQSIHPLIILGPGRGMELQRQPADPPQAPDLHEPVGQGGHAGAPVLQTADHQPHRRP